MMIKFIIYLQIIYWDGTIENLEITAKEYNEKTDIYYTVAFNEKPLIPSK
jgi:hypothetical protein